MKNLLKSSDHFLVDVLVLFVSIFLVFVYLHILNINSLPVMFIADIVTSTEKVKNVQFRNQRVSMKDEGN